MATKTQMMHEGKLYYSMPAAAKLLGTNTTKLKQILGPERIEYRNFRVNGTLWVSAQDLVSYLRRKEHREKSKEPK